MAVALRENHKLAGFERKRVSLVTRAKSLSVHADEFGTLQGMVQEQLLRFEKELANLQKNWGVVESGLERSFQSPEKGLPLAEADLISREQQVDLTLASEHNLSELKKSREVLGELEDSKDDLILKLETHRRMLGDLSKRFAELDFRSFLDRDIDLQLANIDALERALPILEEFTQKIENETDGALAAFRIFESLLEEETEKVTELFRRDGPASGAFSLITNGRYGVVYYDTSDKELKVERPSGDVLSASLLSKGATDQLYLSIRIALARKVLPEKSGFFIFDDALLSSDQKRLERQVQVLKRMAEEGWQVVYFTSKDDTVRTMKRIASVKPQSLPVLP